MSNVGVVSPGDVIVSSMTFDAAQNAYALQIENKNQTGSRITSIRPVKYREVYTDAYFVVEHQPNSCGEYPADGGIIFTDIAIAYGRNVSTPIWEAHTFQPACNSQAHVLSPSSVSFTWDTSAVAPPKDARAAPRWRRAI